jgi:L-rhamnose mutarotase
VCSPWPEWQEKGRRNSSENFKELAIYYGKNGSAPSTHYHNKDIAYLAKWHNKKKIKNTYEASDDEIWAEMIAELEKSGIADMTIFENDPVLVMYSVITDVEAWDRLWHSEVHDRWAVLMAPLMEFNSDGIVNSTELREVFHLETNAGK